jgi:hypothetical protein
MSGEEPRYWRIRHRESVRDRLRSILLNRPPEPAVSPHPTIRIFHGGWKTVVESDWPLSVASRGRKVFVGGPGAPPIGISEKEGTTVLELPVEVEGKTRRVRVWHEPGMTVMEAET